MKKHILFGVGVGALLSLNFVALQLGFEAGKSEGCRHLAWAQAISNYGQPPAEIVPKINQNIKDFCTAAFQVQVP